MKDKDEEVQLLLRENQILFKANVEYAMQVNRLVAEIEQLRAVAVVAREIRIYGLDDANERGDMERQARLGKAIDALKS